MQKDGRNPYSFDRTICIAVLFALATFSFALAGEIAHGLL
jgi:hypothetical protein